MGAVHDGVLWVPTRLECLHGGSSLYLLLVHLLCGGLVGRNVLLPVYLFFWSGYLSDVHSS
ncbi:hypothetical protein GBAR_LOCUS12131 [Geodia barretti]|uniref:Uncharacterized protein n=1 Tax=Geodia barretti TaxID=519541 RepID=A0AA35WKB9_GEOBA|nr:hypothetical protein GBAR_LOCUS12131 [Geodia barretti]